MSDTSHVDSCEAVCHIAGNIQDPQSTSSVVQVHRFHLKKGSWRPEPKSDHKNPKEGCLRKESLVLCGLTTIPTTRSCASSSPAPLPSCSSELPEGLLRNAVLTTEMHLNGYNFPVTHVSIIRRPKSHHKHCYRSSLWPYFIAQTMSKCTNSTSALNDGWDYSALEQPTCKAPAYTFSAGGTFAHAPVHVRHTQR